IAGGPRSARRASRGSSGFGRAERPQSVAGRSGAPPRHPALGLAGSAGAGPRAGGPAVERSRPPERRDHADRGRAQALAAPAAAGVDASLGLAPRVEGLAQLVLGQDVLLAAEL